MNIALDKGVRFGLDRSKARRTFKTFQLFNFSAIFEGPQEMKHRIGSQGKPHTSRNGNARIILPTPIPSPGNEPTSVELNLLTRDLSQLNIQKEKKQTGKSAGLWGGPIRVVIIL